MAVLLAFEICAFWVLLDAARRRLNPLPWALGTAILAPMIIPVYLVKRPLFDSEVRAGGIAWHVLKNFAISWTVLMTAAFIRGALAVTAFSGTGSAITLALIGAIWFFPFASLVGLAFLARKPSVVESGPTGLLQTSPGPRFPAWVSWTVASGTGALILGIVLVLGIPFSSLLHLQRTAVDQEGGPSKSLGKREPPLQTMSPGEKAAEDLVSATKSMPEFLKEYRSRKVITLGSLEDALRYTCARRIDAVLAARESRLRVKIRSYRPSELEVSSEIFLEQAERDAFMRKVRAERITAFWDCGFLELRLVDSAGFEHSSFIP